MSTSIFRNKNMVRPKKAAAPRRRRRMLHRKRLQALGVPEDKIVHMTSKQIRDLLRRPKQTAEMNWAELNVAPAVPAAEEASGQ